MYRGLYKEPGGKLVGVSVRFSNADDCAPHVAECGHGAECAIDGDFFLDGGDDESQAMLHGIEQALREQVLRGQALLEPAQRDVEQEIETVMSRFPNVRMTGMNARGIAIAFDRAMENNRNRGVQTGIAPSEVLQTQSARTRNQQTRQDPSNGNLPNGNVPSGDECARRWRNLNVRIVHDHPRNPREQMDIDMRWARQMAAGEREPTLRIWEWAAPAVVIGRFQSLHDEVNMQAAQTEGFQVVRRCTGGGAMFIEPGNTITYSLYAPIEFAHGITIEESYKLCDHWLVEALKEIGLDVRFSGLNDIATQHGKLGGAAQRRFAPKNGGPGAILHHVTLAYDIDVEKMTRVLNTSREKMSDKAVKSAVKRVDPMRSQTGMSRERIVTHLIAAAERVTM